MKKTNVFLGLLALLFTVVLSGCQEGPNIDHTDIKDVTIEGVEDALIDSNLNQIEFKVSSETKSFDIKKIKAPKGVTAVYCEDAKGNKLKDTLELKEGLNKFTLIFEVSNVKSAWTLKITREKGVEVEKTLTGIEVKDFIKNYKVGEAFKSATITKKYSDNSTEDMDATVDMLEGFDTTTAGEKEVTISYEGFKATFKILVEEEIELTKIEVIASNNRYLLNEEFKGATIKLYYSNNTTDEVNVTSGMLSGFDTTTVGEKTIIVTYDGKTCEYKINVVELTKLEIKEAETKYLVGEEFKGIVITATYSDSVKEDITVAKNMVEGFSTKEAGKKTLKITYLTKTINFEIDVKKIDHIEIKEAAREYLVGEDFVNGTIIVKYTDNTSNELPFTKDNVTGFSTEKEGQKTLTIEYKGNKISYNINVRIIEKLEVKEALNNYLINEDFKGATILVTYKDGTTKEIEATKDMLEGFNTTTTGEKEVKVNYKNKTISFNITVKEIEKLELSDNPTDYLVDDEFKGAKLHVIYTDGSEDIIDLKLNDLEGFDTKAAGKKTISIEYKGKTITYQIVVKGISNITVTGESLYLKNEGFKGLKLTITYNDGENDIVSTVDATEEMLEGFETTTLGKKNITITYNNKSVLYEITVRQIFKIDILNKTLSYLIDDEFKDSKLTIYYTDGKNNTSEEIDITNEMILASGFDNQKLGEQEITFNYKDVKLSYSINVRSIEKLEVIDFTADYLVNEAFKGATLKVSYNDATTVEIELNEEMLEGFTTAKAGSINVKVHYMNKVVAFDILVKEIKNIEVIDYANEYLINDEFKNANLKINYTDGTSDTIKLEAKDLLGFSTKAKGIKSIIVIYKEYQATFKISVRELSKIEIKEAITEYYVGDDLKKTVIKAFYSNGSDEITKDINVTREMLGASFDTSSKGTKTVTVTYENLTTSYEINVKVKNGIIGIEMKSFEANYLHHEEGFKGAKINILYSEKEPTEYDVTMDMLTNFSTEKCGDIVVTVSYANGEFTTTFTIHVEKVLLGIKADDFVLDYEQGDEYKPSNLTLIYSDGSKKNIELKVDMITGFTTQEVGKTEVLIKYEDFEAKKTINVNEKVIGFEIISFDTNYFHHEGFKSGSIMLSYKSGNKSEPIAITRSMLRNFSTEKCGEVVVTVAFGTFTKDVTITVTKTLSGITADDFVTEYKYGDPFTPSNLTLVYSDGSTEKVAINEGMLKGFDTKNPGKNKVTISYEGKIITKYINVKLEVQSIEMDAFTKDYSQFDKFESASILVTYTNGISNIIAVDETMLEGFTTENVTEGLEVTVNYENKTTTFTITVTKKPMGIEVTKFESEYMEGEELKPTEITLRYSDGSFEVIPVTIDMLYGFNTINGGKTTVTVSYQGFTTKFVINVTLIPEYHLEYKTQYILGEKFQGKIIKRLGTQIFEIEITPDMALGFDSDIVGEKTITISYEEFTETIKVNVSEELSRVETIKNILASYQALTKLEPGADINTQFDKIFEESLKNLNAQDALNIKAYLDTLNVTEAQLQVLYGMMKVEVLHIMDIVFKCNFESEEPMIMQLLRIIKIEDVEYIQNTLLKAISIFDNKQLANLLIELNDGDDYTYNNEYEYYNETLNKFVKVQLDELLKLFDDEALNLYIDFTVSVVNATEAEVIELISGIKSIINTIARINPSDIMAIADTIINFPEKGIAGSANGIQTIARIIKEITNNTEAVGKINTFLKNYNINCVNYPIHMLADLKLSTEAVEYIINNINEIASFIENVDISFFTALEDLMLFLGDGEESLTLGGSLYNIITVLNNLLDRVSKNGANDKYIAKLLYDMGEVDPKITLRQLNMIRDASKLDPNNLSSSDIQILKDCFIKFGDVVEDNVYVEKQGQLVIRISDTFGDFKNLVNEKYKFLVGGLPASINLDNIKGEIEPLLKIRGAHNINVPLSNATGVASYKLSFLVVGDNEPAYANNRNYMNRLNTTILIDKKTGNVIGQKDTRALHINGLNKEELFHEYDMVDFVFTELNCIVQMSITDILIDYRIEKVPANEIGLAQLIANTKYGEVRYFIHYVDVDLENPVVHANKNQIILDSNRDDRIEFYINYGLECVSFNLSEIGIDTTKLGKQTARFIHNGKAYTYEFTVITNEMLALNHEINFLSFVCNEKINESLMAPANEINYTEENGITINVTIQNYLKDISKKLKCNTDDLSIKLEFVKMLNSKEGIYNFCLMNKNVVIKTASITASVVSAEDLNRLKVFFNLDEYNFEATLAELQRIKNLTDEEFFIYCKNKFNTLGFTIESMKYGFIHKAKYNNIDLFDILDKNNIGYTFDRTINDKEGTINLYILDGIVTTINLYEESFNRTKLKNIGISNNESSDKRFLTFKYLENKENLFNYFISTMELRLGYKADVYISGEELRSYLENNEYELSVVLQNNGLYGIQLSINGLTAIEEIKVISENTQFEFIITSDNPLICFDKTGLTINDLVKILKSHYIDVKGFYIYDIVKNMTINEIVSIKDTIKERAIIEFKFTLEDMVFVSSIELPYITEKNYSELSFHGLKNKILVANPSNLTIDDIIPYLDIYLYDSMVYGINYNLLKEMYDITFENLGNNHYNVKIINPNNKEPFIQGFDALDILNKDDIVGYDVIHNYNMAYFKDYGSIALLYYFNEITDINKFFFDSLGYIKIDLLSGESYYVSKEEFLKTHKMEIVNIENNLYKLLIDGKVNMKFLTVDYKNYVEELEIVKNKNIYDYGNRQEEYGNRIYLSYYVIINNLKDVNPSAVLSAFASKYVLTVNNQKTVVYDSANIEEFINRYVYRVVEAKDNNGNSYYKYMIAISRKGIELDLYYTDSPLKPKYGFLNENYKNQYYQKVTIDNIVNNIDSLNYTCINGESKTVSDKNELKNLLANYTVEIFEDYFEITFTDFNGLTMRLGRDYYRVYSNDRIHIVRINDSNELLNELKSLIERHNLNLYFGLKSTSGNTIYLNDIPEVINSIKILNQDLSRIEFSLEYDGKLYTLTKNSSEVDLKNVELKYKQAIVANDINNVTVEEALSQFTYESQSVSLIGYSYKDFLSTHNVTIEKTFDHTVEYQKYRINIIANNSGAQNDYYVYVYSKDKENVVLNISLNFNSREINEEGFNGRKVYVPNIKESYTFEDFIPCLASFTIDTGKNHYYVYSEAEMLSAYNKFKSYFNLEKISSNIYKLTVPSFYENGKIINIKVVNNNELGHIRYTYKYLNKIYEKLSMQDIYDEISEINLVYLNGNEEVINDRSLFSKYAQIDSIYQYDNRLSIRFVNSNFDLNLQIASNFKGSINAQCSAPIKYTDNLKQAVLNEINNKIVIDFNIGIGSYKLEGGNLNNLNVVESDSSNAKVTFDYLGNSYEFSIQISKKVI